MTIAPEGRTMNAVLDSNPAVLCVDDEPAVLAGLARQLRHHFRVATAESGADALRLVDENPAEFAVVVSDMMMPGMNGAEFLRKVRDVSPRSQRVLLTGYADADLAAAAVNDGAISRYLTKPCPSERLVSTLRDCADDFRREVIEQEVLERTLVASVEALAQTLSLASPQGFARIERVRAIVRDVVDSLNPPDRWAIEVAVPLSQLGAVTLPHEMLERWSAGLALSPMEERLARTVPDISLGIIREIPRLEVVERIIRGASLPDDVRRERADLHVGAAIVRLAFQIDALETSGMMRAEAVDVLRRRAEQAHDLDDALVLSRLARRPVSGALLIRMRELEPGMVLAQDCRSDSGVFLVGRGTVVTPAIIARLRHFEMAGHLAHSVVVRDDT